MGLNYDLSNSFFVAKVTISTSRQDKRHSTNFQSRNTVTNSKVTLFELVQLWVQVKQNCIFIAHLMLNNAKLLEDPDSARYSQANLIFKKNLVCKEIVPLLPLRNFLSVLKLFFVIRLLFFRPGLNIVIFLPTLS